MKNAIHTIISFIAITEFIIGAILIEGGTFAFGIFMMVMCLAWFGINIIKYGRR